MIPREIKYNLHYDGIWGDILQLVYFIDCNYLMCIIKPNILYVYV